ncbi:MAG TPA: carbohydrate-binding family 9-like protein [Pyrinomonadaceae bacterium]|nr:carbohydrate-binding family 9-like protein [Pyrinomonadaceae bacterium]
MSGDPETLVALHTKVEIEVEDFENPVWEKSQAVLIQHDWAGHAVREARHAEARIVWSDLALTVGFRCNQREPLLINPLPDLTQKKIGLWEMDVCELFIAPGAETPERYFEFEVAPTGEWIDLVIDFTTGERQTDWDYRSEMKAAARVFEDKVSMSMQIPWSDSFPKPNAEDIWRGNLFRCIGLGNERYMAWQPTYTPEPLFHVPEAFGYINFVR